MLCPLRGRAPEIGSIIVRIVILKPWRRAEFLRREVAPLRGRERVAAEA